MSIKIELLKTESHAWKVSPRSVIPVGLINQEQPAARKHKITVQKCFQGWKKLSVILTFGSWKNTSVRCGNLAPGKKYLFDAAVCAPGKIHVLYTSCSWKKSTFVLLFFL